MSVFCLFFFSLETSLGVWPSSEVFDWDGSGVPGTAPIVDAEAGFSRMTSFSEGTHDAANPLPWSKLDPKIFARPNLSIESPTGAATARAPAVPPILHLNRMSEPAWALFLQVGLGCSCSCSNGISSDTGVGVFDGYNRGWGIVRRRNRNRIR